MAADPIATVGLTAPILALGRKLDHGALVFDAVISEFHPATFELRGGHSISIVLDRQNQLAGWRNGQIDERCASIPCVGHKLGERDFGVLGDTS